MFLLSSAKVVGERMLQVVMQKNSKVIDDCGQDVVCKQKLVPKRLQDQRLSSPKDLRLRLHLQG